MENDLVSDIMAACQCLRIHGVEPDTIVMSRKMYSRMYVGVKRGNSHQRRLRARKLKRIERYIIKLQ